MTVEDTDNQLVAKATAAAALIGAGLDARAVLEGLGLPDMKLAKQPLPRRAWTPSEVGDQLKLPYDGVLDLIRVGTIRAVKLGRHYRISNEELDRLLNHSEQVAS